MKKPYRWDNLTSPQVKAQAEAEAIVLVPTGSTEQHGPHLPVGTDAIISTYMCEQIAQELISRGIPAIVAPTVAVANSMHHMSFAGSMSLEPTTYIEMLTEYCRAVASHGFKKIVIVNGHGGNTAPNSVAQIKINRELGFPVYHTMYFAGIDQSAFIETQKGMIHACEAETSFILAIDETLVDPIYLETSGNMGGATEGETRGLISTFHRMETTTPNGVMGNSLKATKEKGEKMIAASTKSVADILSDENLWKSRV